MPELPEVETIRRSLAFLEGKLVQSLWFSPLAPVEKCRPTQIRKILETQALRRLSRRGKYLLVQSPKGSLVLHLGMTGQLRYFSSAADPRVPHTHLEIRFADGSLLRFIDPRRFGTLSVSLAADGADNPFLARLGPDFDDPLLDEEEFLRNCRRHSGLTLKSLTLNQGIAAGLGNIYACEALYAAELDPRKRVRRIKEASLRRLLQKTREVLALGIAKGGSSIRDYFDGLGNRGVMREYLQVYDREGLKTLDGRGTVRRIVQNARSTWFSPEIQKG